jgi:hypothetical protein
LSVTEVPDTGAAGIIGERLVTPWQNLVKIHDVLDGHRSLSIIQGCARLLIRIAPFGSLTEIQKFEVRVGQDGGHKPRSPIQDAVPENC